jgi:hypothetical protein
MGFMPSAAWIWPTFIIFCTLMGSFIDFLLGRPGRKRVIEFLEDWWVLFEDVTRRNFAKKEAIFFLSIIDRAVGRSAISIRRLSAVMIVLFCFLVYNISSMMMQAPALGAIPKYEHVLVQFPHMLIPETPVVLISLFGLALSISISRKISNVLPRLIGDTFFQNCSCLMAVLLLCYALIVCWPPVTLAIINYAAYLRYFSGLYGVKRDIYALWNILKDTHWVINPIRLAPELYDIIVPAYFASDITNDRIIDPVFSSTSRQIGLLSGLVRLAIAALFMLTFFVQSVVGRPLSLVWLRIVQSDKPVFAIVFGGISGGITLMSQIAQHL